MITVACVHWGDKFSNDYVYNLKSMVERNTNIEHRFVCLTDKPKNKIESKILKPGLQGWWNKLQLFDLYHSLGDRVVYIDLDTLIVENIDWLLSDKSSFMGIEDLGSVNPHQKHLKNVLQSGVLSFNTQDMSYVWNEFILRKDHCVRAFRGDGEYLNSLIPAHQKKFIQKNYPNKLKSYKYQVYPSRPDEETSIVCFHGRPSIIQAQREVIKTPMKTYEPQSWIADYWR